MSINTDAFRTAARHWLRADFADEVVEMSAYFMAGEALAGPAPAFAAWREAMGAKGWAVPTWPERHGGGGLSEEDAIILREEMDAIGAWSPIGGMGVMMLGPTLLEFGTEAQ